MFIKQKSTSSFLKNCGSKLFYSLSAVSFFPMASSFDYNYKNYCFEAKDDKDNLAHDHTLSCSSEELLNTLIRKLQESCDIFQDGYDDCARWFVNVLNYGPGFFGGSRCELSYHNGLYLPNQCILDTLEKNIPTGFGTNIDILTTSLLALGGTLVLGSVIYGVYLKKKGDAEPEAIPLNEVDEEADRKNYGPGSL
jgi:hypothetical protein